MRILNLLLKVDPGKEIVEDHNDACYGKGRHAEFRFLDMNLKDVNWNLRTVHIKYNHEKEAQDREQTAELVGPSKLFRELLLFNSELQFIKLFQVFLIIRLLFVIVLWI